ncbi:hypothetical protein [Methanosarcina mazei]|jgi:hypothetical protein|uniref:Uncharacterized protein n=4 Tax=Methanosarcina mazei TaxID=2209 RepID=A0A0F8EMU4_METMZ|nr:hypothetical protein [Methanosarcina mazei]AKB72780.1 hypothetical protein MSMAC_2890 [Methanosarcina mazei C16]AKB40484.1 hypothetical protein MSMAW_1493 [Methanosarcina mazei WWM610]KKG11704.1 hypothetical protein DU34_14725 [Methanosarcina mazei]KKG34985.1 hypothetical protein DU49_14805 [Methanosarcina mazei]KKG37068.1 hypothetical protein DU35_15515 [Methanosarcina mazei]
MEIHKLSPTSPSNIPEKPDFMGLKVRKYPSTPKKVFKFTWDRKPPPACLAALHKKEVERRRNKKVENRKKKI